ncbi:hypothetical protein Lser_V15G12311 [Lactuca serriola]
MAIIISLVLSFHRPLCSSSSSTPKHLLKSRICPLWSLSFLFCLPAPPRSTILRCYYSHSLSPATAHRRGSFCSATLPSSMSMVSDDNPLLKDFVFPMFDAIDDCHVRPRMHALLKKLTQEFLALLPIVRDHIIDGYSPEAREVFHREFDFFEKVTTISGALYPLPKEERRAGIKRGLEKIQLPGDDCYLPTAPSKLVRGIQVNSGIPLQSATKVPIMITFDVFDRDGDPKDIKLQACIFKQYTELPRRTSDELESALRVIDEALQISNFSEQLLQMKADILIMLRTYEHVIQMCEQNPNSAEVDTHTSPNSWRSTLIVKSYFNLGRLAEALEFIKKQETSGQITERLESMSLDSLIPLANTIRELLSRKGCSPNSVLVFEGRMATLRAMQTIPKGSDLPWQRLKAGTKN